jgi:hypothetical protein
VAIEDRQNVPANNAASNRPRASIIRVSGP